MPEDIDNLTTGQVILIVVIILFLAWVCAISSVGIVITS